MIIFIRGLPGSGKTHISNDLGARLNIPVIHSDDLKKELTDRKPEAFFKEEVIPYSYDRILQEIMRHKDNNVIIEELFRTKDFVNKILSLCTKEAIISRWFQIDRDFREVIKVNKERKRKVKNDSQILERILRQIQEIEIPGEVLIKNTSVQEAVDEIVSLL
jgi:broad-specificity NMP kinase